MDQYVVILVQFSIVIHSRSWFPLPTDKTYKSISLSSQQLKFIYCPAYSLHPLFSSPKMHYAKKNRHIKLAVYAWSTKCRRNQKLIAQFALTLRDESFEPN